MVCRPNQHVYFAHFLCFLIVHSLGGRQKIKRSKTPGGSKFEVLAKALGLQFVFLMKKLFLTFALFSFFISLLTSPEVKANSFTKTKEERLRLTDKDGEELIVGLTTYKNEFGSLEVRIDAAGMPKLLDRLNPTIAFGRDLNDDQKIDTWFFLTKNGIETEFAEGRDALGKDILSRLLLKRHQTSARLYVTTATTTLLSFFLLSAKESTDIEAHYTHDWMNLEEMKIRLEREMSSNANTLTRDQIQFQYSVISQGYKSLADEMEHFAKADFWKWAGADVGLWVSGSFLFKSAASILLKAGSFITETSVYLAFKDELALFVAKNISVLKEKGSVIASKLGVATGKREENAVPLAFKMSAFRLRATVAAAISADIAKKRLTKVVLAASKWPLKIAQGAKSEWQYIATSLGIQLTAETTAHFSEVYDPNPLIMAKNILTNEDILQNIGFMTTDTILMTGISKNLNSMKARFLVSGFVGMHNSAMINLVIKGEDNYKRVGLDTAWESVIGNAQVQIDLKALESFEKMALKKNNPKLKLLGYAVVLVNQGTGYFLYSKATDKVKNSDQETTVKLVPVLAEN